MCEGLIGGKKNQLSLRSPSRVSRCIVSESDLFPWEKCNNSSESVGDTCRRSSVQVVM